ncbi:MAG: hypothetical protein HQM02_05470 [Magnetococcales bacterium]|nr:hypothetical protein [Magnetococcales bacterium]
MARIVRQVLAQQGVTSEPAPSFAVELTQSYDFCNWSAVSRQVLAQQGITRPAPLSFCIGLVQSYAEKRIRAELTAPYGNAPIQAEHGQPIHFTLDAALTQTWSLMERVQAQCAQPWTSTTSVSTECSFHWNLLERNPVAASLTQIWNLSENRTIRLSGTTVRAFHRGEPV